MKTSLTKDQLKDYVNRQLDFYLPDDYKVNETILQLCISQALECCELCFTHILVPGYRTSNGEALFSHLHMDQYGTFLYFLGNSIWTTYHEKQVCDKLLNLNRILNVSFV